MLDVVVLANAKRTLLIPSISPVEGLYENDDLINTETTKRAVALGFEVVLVCGLELL